MTFTIPGTPFPKQRARVMRGGWSFTPKKTVQAGNAIKLIAIASRQAHKDSILGPLNTQRMFCSVVFFGARQNADLDNLFKLVTDACQGVLYKNDCQIDQVEILRARCEKGNERTEVTIEAI